MGNSMTDFTYSIETAYHDVCTIFVTRGKWTVDFDNYESVGWGQKLLLKWTTQ